MSWGRYLGHEDAATVDAVPEWMLLKAGARSLSYTAVAAAADPGRVERHPSSNITVIAAPALLAAFSEVSVAR